MEGLPLADGTRGGVVAREIALEEQEGEWSAAAQSWGFVLVRPRENRPHVAALCLPVGLAPAPVLTVRWTVPLRGDLPHGAMPPPELLGASHHFREGATESH